MLCNKIITFIINGKHLKWLFIRQETVLSHTMKLSGLNLFFLILLIEKYDVENNLISN